MHAAAKRDFMKFPIALMIGCRNCRSFVGVRGTGLLRRIAVVGLLALPYRYGLKLAARRRRGSDR